MASSKETAPLLVHNDDKRNPDCGDDDSVVDLCHGTSKAGAANIRKHGVDPSYATDSKLDFGTGFYTTRSRTQAEERAGRKKDGGAVLHFRVRQSDLDGLRNLEFQDDDPNFHLFMKINRTGGSIDHDREMITGSMLRNVGAFLGGKPPRLTGDQTTFFGGRAAQMLN